MLDDPEEFNEEEFNESPLSDDERQALRDELYHFFIRYIDSEVPKERERAVQAVAGLECDPRLTEPLRRLIRDNDPEKYTLAIRCIGLWKHTDGSDLLIHFMTDMANQSKWNEPLVESVLNALGEIGDAAAYEFLSHYALEAFDQDTDRISPLGMACNESMLTIARKGHEGALQYLINGCRHPAWNMRESCAACFGALYSGKSSLPKIVYETLMHLTRDENRNVRIAAYMSLDEIIGLDEDNRKILREAREQQIHGETFPERSDKTTG